MTPLFAELAIPDNFWVGAIGSLIFGMIGMFLLVFGYKVFDWLTPKLHVEEDLQKGNIAVAIVVAALLASIAYITANVIH